MKEHIIVLDTIKKCNVGAGLAPALVMKEHIVVLDSIKLWTITQGKGLPVAHPSAASPTSFEKLSARDPSLLV